jgi:hypothetical protein
MLCRTEKFGRCPTGGQVVAGSNPVSPTQVRGCFPEEWSPRDEAAAETPDGHRSVSYLQPGSCSRCTAGAPSEMSFAESSATEK